MDQLIIIRGTSISGNAERWSHPFSPVYSGITPVTDVHCQVAQAGTLRNLKVRLESALGGGDSLTFRLHLNGSATALTATVTDPATTAELTGVDVAIAVGDTLAVSQVGSGAPAAVVFELSYEFEGTTAASTIHGFGSTGAMVSTTTRYMPLLYGSSLTTVAATSDCKAGVGGTITHWRIVLSAAPGAGDTRSFVIEKNGVAQDGSGGTPNTTVTISDTAVAGNASFTLTVAALDKLRVRGTATGTPANALLNGCLAMTSAIVDQQTLCSQPEAVPSTAATSYARFVGQQPSSLASEADARQLVGVSGLRVSGLHVELSVAPGVGNSWTYTLRRNGTNTAQTLTIADTATIGEGPMTEVVLVEDDLVDFEIIPTSSPDAGLPKITFTMTNALVRRGCFVAGVNTTIDAPRSAAFGLDGNTNTQSNPGELAVFGDLRVTGTTTLTGGSVNLSAMMDSLGT